MLVSKINWESLQCRFSACRSMCDAGESDKAKTMLRELAAEITIKLQEQPDDNR